MQGVAAALHHVARIAGPVTDAHRLALEAVLLGALAEAEGTRRAHRSLLESRRRVRLDR